MIQGITNAVEIIIWISVAVIIVINAAIEHVSQHNLVIINRSSDSSVIIDSKAADRNGLSVNYGVHRIFVLWRNLWRQSELF